MLNSRSSIAILTLAGAVILFVLSACSPTAPAELAPSISADLPIDTNIIAAQPPVYDLGSTPTLLPQPVIDEANAAQQVFINLYERVAPSVVNIEVVTDSKAYGEVNSSGSGFIYDASGLIITNAHVVRDAKIVTVTFNDGYAIPAEIVGMDDFSDLAVIKVPTDPSRLLPVQLGDSESLKTGQMVVAIGNPFGLMSSMTTGIISATGRAIKSALMLNPSGNSQFKNPSIIQIDAQINPGNSGGPLLDLNGSVIGVNTAIRSENGLFQGVGFAVPVNTVKRVIPQLIQNGKAEYSWLGIGASDQFTVASVASELSLPVSYGVLVNEVYDGSPAQTAGIRGGTTDRTVRGIQVRTGGDIIIALNGEKIRDMDALLSYLVTNTSPGDTMTITLIRDDITMDVKVALLARPN